MFKQIILATFMLTSTATFAVSNDDFDVVDYLTIGSVQTRDVTANKGEDFELPPISVKDGYVPYLDEVIMIVDKLIALGEKVYTIVEKGKPVVTTDFAPSFSVIPKHPEYESNFADTFLDMEMWSAPKTRIYETIYKNLFGATVVRFKYAIHFQYNGQLSGNGRYLTGVNVTPINVDVSWGYEFDAKAYLDSISNRGTAANPVAGATVGVAYTVKTILKQSDVVNKYHVTGTGEIVPMQ